MTSPYQRSQQMLSPFAIAPQTPHSGPPAEAQASPPVVHPGFSAGASQLADVNPRAQPAPQTLNPLATPQAPQPVSPIGAQPFGVAATVPASPWSATPQGPSPGSSSYASGFEQAASPPQQGQIPGFHAQQMPAAVRPTFGPGATPGVRAPPMEVFDEGESLVIEFELPGVSKKDIQLVGRERLLAIEADAGVERSTEGRVSSETAPRMYKREIPLDIEIVADDIQATFQNGILKVTLPKKEPTAGLKTVEIK